MCLSALSSYMSMYHVSIWSPCKLEKGIRSLGTGDIHSYVLCWVLRIKPGYFGKALKFTNIIISEFLVRGKWNSELLVYYMLAFDECSLWC